MVCTYIFLLRGAKHKAEDTWGGGKMDDCMYIYE